MDLWPSSLQRTSASTLHWLTAYQVELEALPAFLGNRSLHGDIIAADCIFCIRTMAEFVVSTPEGETQNTVAPSNGSVLRDHLRSLIRIGRFELESKPLLTIHTVLYPYCTSNCLAAVAHSIEGRPGHVAVFMRAVSSHHQDWSTEFDALPFLPHLHIEATTRCPSQPYCDQGRVVMLIPGSKERHGEGVWGHPLED
jgi:hypothetical protein